jgi:chemotaxis protein CheX
MTLHERIVAGIRTSTEQVFSTMLGAEIGEGEAYNETTPPQANDGILSFIGLAGPWAGTGSIGCSVGAACSVCSQMLMTEATGVTEEVLDAVAELTNMVVGNVKTELEAELGPLGLSIPTVVWGRNFRAKTNVHGEWSCVKYVWNGEPIVIRMCLAPTEPAHHSIPQCSVQSCHLDV